MTSEILTAPKAANRINKVLTAFSELHKTARFPIDVKEIAFGCHEIFGWTDPISEVKAEKLPGFEGCLFPNEAKSKWLLLFNDGMTSSGRIRFTMAHELGHYVLHRQRQQSFQCSDASNMRNLSADERDFEYQADEFASYLLMPLDDFRKETADCVDLDQLGQCAVRYGVSLTAAILKWLSYTDQKAILVLSNDGFINWSWSSDAAAKSGAFFKTRSSTIELPQQSLAMDSTMPHDRTGKNVAMRVWFPHADAGLSLREMKVSSEQYGNILTLLVLPTIADAWPPFAGRR